MKKIIALAIALIMALTLAACGGGGDTPSETPNGSDTNSPTLPQTQITSSSPFAPDSTTDSPPSETPNGGNTDMPSSSGSTQDSGTSEGIYEGETNASGEPSGYGEWLYHNYRYIGYWENGMPGGEGTLFFRLDGVTTRTVTGNFVDGLAHGAVTLTHHWAAGNLDLATPLDVNMGVSAEDETTVVKSGKEYYLTHYLYGVPPWADVETDPTLDAPDSPQ